MKIDDLAALETSFNQLIETLIIKKNLLKNSLSNLAVKEANSLDLTMPKCGKLVMSLMVGLN